MKHVKFKQWTCRVEKSEYSNGRTALMLKGSTGNPVAVATVNMPDEPLDKDHVFIKNWSENEGILEALTEAGVIEPTGRTVPAGMTVAHEAKLMEV